MWLACHTQDEIAEACGIGRQTATDELASMPDLERLPKPAKNAALYSDDFDPPLYNVWTFATRTYHPTNARRSQ
jgi:hypothetical protein